MSEEEYIQREVNSSENAVRKMLFYYASSLTDAGIEDVRQYIATKIPEMIDFSKEQSDFIYMNINKENKIYDNLNNSIKLLDGILQSKKLDLDSIKIVKQILSLMVEDMKEFTEM
jgi:hypothetical protein